MSIRSVLALLLSALPQWATASTLNLAPCPAGQIKASGAECGTLEVYEDRQAQQGRTITLNVAVLPAFSRNPAPDPLFAFAGGPGMGSTELAELTESARKIMEHLWQCGTHAGAFAGRQNNDFKRHGSGYYCNRRCGISRETGFSGSAAGRLQQVRQVSRRGRPSRGQ